MHVGVRMPAAAFSDDRFGALALLLGLADSDHARAKYERLLDVCTLTQHYTLSPLRVQAVLGEGGVEALVRAELGQLVSVHQPTKYAVELELLPTPAAVGEWLVRLEYAERQIEWYGQTLKGASRGGNEKARRSREARGEPVDNPEGNVSASRGIVTDDPSRLSTAGVPQGNPQGTPHGVPQEVPSRARLRSEIPDPDLRDQIQKRPMRAPGLRVLEGGAEGSGS